MSSPWQILVYRTVFSTSLPNLRLHIVRLQSKRNDFITIYAIASRMPANRVKGALARLSGDNASPVNCSTLIFAGPLKPYPSPLADKITHTHCLCVCPDYDIYSCSSIGYWCTTDSDGEPSRDITSNYSS